VKTKGLPFRRLGRPSNTSDEHREADEPATGATRARIGKQVWLGIAVIVLIAVGVVALIPTSNPSNSPQSTTRSTTVSSGADTILAIAVQSGAAGFTLESSKQPPSASDDWATLQQVSDGSEANVTVRLYPSTNASQSYFDRFVAGQKGLSGYTDVSSALTSFQQYGACYAVGEDVDSIAVINGVCTKGNVFLQVHLVSGIAFSDLEGDLTSIMGALYQSAN
jgi:hypothetical protein